MNANAGRKWRSDDRLEAYVRDRLVNYEHFIRNHEGKSLPLMTVTIPGQFNESGHGIDIMAVDRRRDLWIIEVSRGSRLGAGFVKHLGTRKDGNSQMSPAWRTLKKDKFLELPEAHQKLIALFDSPGLSFPDARTLFETKLNDHRVAIIVPEGCHVEVLDTGILFGPGHLHLCRESRHSVTQQTKVVWALVSMIRHSSAQTPALPAMPADCLHRGAITPGRTIPAYRSARYRSVPPPRTGPCSLPVVLAGSSEAGTKT